MVPLGTVCYVVLTTWSVAIRSQQVLQESDFPDGSYALPMSIDGCPEGASRGWGQGYINITTTMPLDEPRSFPVHCRQRVVDYQSNIEEISNRFTNVTGPFGQYSLQLNFCLKSNKYPFNNSKRWPTGAYGLFRAMDKCPDEFSEHEMKLCLPPLLHYNADGELPNYEIHDLFNYTDLPDFIYENGFPGVVHKINGIPAVFNLCWNQYTGCEQLGDWLMIDALKTVFVSAVMLLTPVPSDILHIYVSDMKWSFLNGGALLCRHRRVPSAMYKLSGLAEHYRLSDIYICYRSQHGRYITLSFSRRIIGGIAIYKSYDVGVFSYTASQVTELLARGDGNYSAMSGIAKMLNHTDLSSERCNQELGMIDLSIADSKITASSWQLDRPPTYARPQHQGWCAAENDTEPYIQIELRCVTSVDGIILYNWLNLVETLDKNVRINTAYVDGPVAFQIEYGTDENNLTSGKLQIFKYDRSQSLEDPQTFMIMNPVLARFIRIIPKSFAGNTHTCMKFELLGCKTSGCYKAGNSRGYSGTVSRTMSGLECQRWDKKYPHIPHENYKDPNKFPEGSLHEAKNYCRDPDNGGFTWCYTMSRNTRWERCDIPVCNQPEDYDPLPIECQDSQRRKSSSAVLPSYQSLKLLKKVTKQSCKAYPYNTSDCVDDLQVNTDESCTVFTATDNQRYLEYIQLPDCSSVLCISEMRSSGSGMFKRQWITSPFGEIFYITKTGFLTSPGFPITYPYNAVFTWKLNLTLTEGTHVGIQFTSISLRAYKEDDYCHDNIKVLFEYENRNAEYILTSKDNDKTPSYDFTMPNSLESASIVFNVCSSGNLISDGKGFRALAYTTDQKLCLQKPYDTNNEMRKWCDLPQGELMADSVLVKTTSSEFLWEIQADNSLIMTLEILEMEVICSSGSRLMLFNEQAVCNANRPYGDETNVVFPEELFEHYRMYDWMYDNMYFRRWRAADMIYHDLKSNSLFTYSVIIRYNYYAISYTGINQGFKISYQMKKAVSYSLDEALSKGSNVLRFLVCKIQTESIPGLQDSFEGRVSSIKHQENIELKNVLSLMTEIKDLQTAIKHDQKTSKKQHAFCAYGNGEVCSKQIGKCYTITYAFESSWKDAAEDCRKNGTRLTSLKTEQELRFVHSLILKYYESISERVFITKLKSYIGLFSFIDSSSKILESWIDGSTSTYTAWDTNQPFRRDILQCTQIQIMNPNILNSWSSCYCAEKSDVVISVCERKNEGYTHLETMSPPSNHSDLREARDSVTLFHCTSGEWMSLLVECNGIAECLDASDETNCIQNDDCDEDEFKCADGTCIHVSKVCDYKFDCLDESDEFCVYSDCKDQFKCANKQCISADERCDSVKNCKDGSDEINCGHTERVSDICNPEKAFHCTSSRTCISKRLVCDNFEDCSGGTDEQKCNNYHFNSCKNLWLDGQHISGFFKVKSGKEGKDVYVFCNFDSVVTTGNMQMTILNTDTVPMNEYRYEFRAPVDLDELSRRGFCCKQRGSLHFTPQCSSIKRKVSIKANCRSINECEITIRPHRNRLLPMTADFSDDETYIDIDLSDWPNKINRYIIYRGSERVYPFMEVNRQKWNNDTIDVHLTDKLKPGYIINRGDIICKANLTSEEIKNQKVFCREGISAVEPRHRCLYERDTNEYVIGCRTLEHLKDCDNFSCRPELYFKCPRSYCIPLMYVCDGNNDCAYGEDEVVCACPNNPPADIVILAAVSIHERALQLAGMLYSPSPKHKVRVLKKMTHDNTLIGTEILTNTKYSSKADISYSYTDVGELFKDSEGIHTLIVISGDKDMDERKSFLLISNLLSAQVNMTYKLYNVTIAKASNRLITQMESLNATEIVLKDEKIIGTIGPVLFPEHCNRMLTCTGMYRCMLSKVCIPQKQVCDHTLHCPFGDDEDHCDFVCPSNCSCDLLIVNCSNVQMNGDFNLSVSTRILDISHSQSLAIELLEKLKRKLSFPFLLRLNASWCGLNSINTDAFKLIPNLISLDLSYNNFSKFEQNMFVNLKSLKVLFLTGNKLLTSIDQGAFNGLQLKHLTIAGTKLFTLKANTFAGSSLTSLDIVGNGLREIDDFAFNGSTIEILNIFEKSIEGFGKNIFSGVVALKHLTTPAYKYCCLRPMHLAEDNCLPLKDEFSSCRDLMRNTALLALLWTIGLLALFGNLFSLFYRLIYDRKKMKLGYGIFVTNLAVSDLLMGIYMLIIAVADTLYRDRYIEHDDYWKNSDWCKFAGILSTISSEGSVLFVFLITLDRFFVVKFPFGQIRFKTKSAMLASMTVWIVVLLIAVLPVFYVDYFQERFYSKTGVCLALPLTRDQPPGWLYSILIFIVFNMIAFILIATGQGFIYLEIKKNSITKNGMNVSRRENDLKVARNLLLVVTTDFACWFPVCTMGLMALSGHVIPGDVYAWTAVLILPVNSALNPFLYTISAIYGAKKFTPSEDEQSHVNTEVGKDFLNVLRDVLTNKVTPSRRISALNNLLKDPRLTTYEAARVIYQVARLLHHLHENGLVLMDIVKEDIVLETSISGQIKIIRVDTARELQWSPRKKDFRENVFKLGQLADVLLQKIDSTSL